MPGFNRRVRPKLEKEDERACSAKWRELGYWETKIEKAPRNGIPDRYYQAPFVGFWCEWKNADGELSVDQEREIESLRRNGATVIVPRNADEFWSFVRAAKSAAEAGL